MNHSKKLGVVDFGGQYAHLISSRVRRLGAYTEILSNEESLEKYQEYAGLILSGGPNSVYEKDSPQIDAKVLELGIPILGICYGHQLIMKILGGKVESSANREYGPAILEVEDNAPFIVKGFTAKEKIWMSHGDEVVALPSGFKPFGRTDHCRYAGVFNDTKKIYGIQFHPEVTHSEKGLVFLGNFISICGLSNTWGMKEFLDAKISEIKAEAKDNNVFMLISGGVDSTVSYLLLAKALGAERVKGLLIDTGFMRFNEVENLRHKLHDLGVDLLVSDESERFYSALHQKSEPEEKRKIIGQLFIDCKNDVADKFHLAESKWLLGQGTIYPDTIESGGTKHSHKIKTHHNRVQAVLDLMEKGRVLEPIRDLYKDEVRELGTMLGLEKNWVIRHPFPGPGLAVRMLSSHEYHGFNNQEGLEKVISRYPQLQSKILPVQSVGVQGDQRSYSACVVLSDSLSDWGKYDEASSLITNLVKGVNRIVLLPFVKDLSKVEFHFSKVELDRSHSDILREVDDIVWNHLVENNLVEAIWQMPVVLVPVGSEVGKFSIVLRPVESQEAMTANFYPMDRNVLQSLCAKIQKVKNISYIFYDITHKPPGTIEWE